MKNKWIQPVFCVSLCIAALVFLGLCLFTDKNDTRFLIAALFCTAACNLGNAWFSRQKTEEEQ